MTIQVKKSNNTIAQLLFLSGIFIVALLSTIIFSPSNINIINKVEGFNNTNNNNNHRVTVDPFDFMQYNISSPSCCEYSSGYSNGNGCICITPTQKKILDSRGGNRYV
mgnify:CR=1 FL=1